MLSTNGRSIHKGIPLTPTCGVHWSVRHPRRGFKFYRAPILPPKPKAIARNVPPTPQTKGPPAPATPSLQGICENLPPALHIHGPFSSTWNSCAFLGQSTSRLSSLPLISTEGHRPEAATLSTTLSASELLPLR